MAITTTAAQILAAVNAKYPDLVTVSLKSGDNGTGIVTPLPIQRLTTTSAPSYPQLWETTMDPAGTHNGLVFRSVEGTLADKNIGVLYVDTGRDDEPLEILLIDGRILYIQLGTPDDGAPGRASGYAELSADSGNIADTWTDTGLTVTLTLPSGTSGKVLLLATLHSLGGNGNELVAYRFVIDGVAQKRVGSNRYGNSVIVTEALSMIASGLAVGDHTFKVQAINSENVNFHIAATSYQSNLSAVEL